MRPRDVQRAQHGWVGLIVLLFALVIFGLLAPQLLGGMGLTRPEATVARSSSSGAPAEHGSGAVPPGAAGALDAARSFESTIQRQAGDIQRRLDEMQK